MKIKGSVKALKPKILILISALLGAGFLALRLWQSMTLIDPVTGFFTDRSHPTVLLFYICAVGMAVLLPVLFYLCPLSKAEHIAARRNIFHALACVVFAFAIGADYISKLTSGGDRTRVLLAGCITGAVAFVSLLICAFSFFTGRELIKKVKLLHLFPVVWALCRTIGYFTIYASYLKVSTLLTEIFSDVFLMIFLFEYGKKISGLGGDGNSPAYLSTALLTAILQLSVCATGLAGLLGAGDFVYGEISFVRIAAALFCVSAIPLLLGNRVPDYVPAAPADETVETYPLEAAPDGSGNAADETESV